MTIRDMVQAIQIEVRDTDILPQRAAELLMKATALVGNVNTEIREADAAFNQVLLTCLDGDEAANRARSRADVRPEEARRREARDTLTLLVEVIRSLKVFIKAQQEEMRLAR